MITGATLKAWTMQIVNGKPIDPVPETEREKRVFERLREDIDRLTKAGLGVEIPFDWPDISEE